MENSAERCKNPPNGYTRVVDGQKLILRKKAYRYTNKVAVISGCGEAREMLNAGLVGPGLLSAVVLGSGFASPRPEQILYVIREIKPDTNAGVLVVIINTSGDVINFQLATESAQKQGIKVEVVILGTDCITDDKVDAVQHSGLISSLLVMKICSALAEKGESIEFIVEYVKNIQREIGTAGLTLTPCSTTKDEVRFRIEKGMDLFGVKSDSSGHLLQNEILANKLAADMVEHVIRFYSRTKVDFKSNFTAGLVINSSGKLSEFEQLTCTEGIVKQLKLRGIAVARCLSRHCITSWEKASLQMSLVPLDDRLQQLLDWDCVAPSWPRYSSVVKMNDDGKHVIIVRQGDVNCPIVENNVNTEESTASLLGSVCCTPACWFRWYMFGQCIRCCFLCSLCSQ